ncbi:hypothetical protein [Carboxylicivirga sp. N1Y90]|uniref:hypothetical protein n=1 Tax=Carboxylicivirga fragile TaxID=3417571 RepID=UPI003D331C68|nr:hypothetical protein [Marinilabiliaceae bacterium N1Y90]
MKNKKLHKEYLDLLKKNALMAPDDVWNRITSDLDNDRRSKSEDEEQNKILDDSWNKIENELDIDNVWSNISAELDKYNKTHTIFHRFNYWVAAAIILFMISFSGVLQFYSKQTKPELYTNNNAQKSTNSLGYTSETKLNNAISGKEIDNQTINAFQKAKLFHPTIEEQKKKVRIASALNNTKLSFSNEENETFINAEESFSLNTKLKNKNALIRKPIDYKIVPYIALEKEKVFETDWIKAMPIPSPSNSKNTLAFDRKDSRWTTGIITSLKNTYLLSAETIEGFSSSGMNSSKITISPELGLNIKYALNKRYLINSNLFLSSSSKQNYSSYYYGQYTSKELDLNYIAVEMSIMQNAKHNFLGSDKIIRRNVAGIYIAHLKSASETIVNDAQDISEIYASIDYGLILGQEFEIRSQGPIKVSTGINIKYGLPNIYTGDNSIPGHLNKTHNASVEFRIGIAYRWSSKIGIDHYLGLKTK